MFDVVDGVYGVLFGMEYLLAFLLCLGFVNSCPSNCICEETESTCIITHCDDPISLEYTDFLIIGGLLCNKQRVFLNNLTPNTIIILKQDNCESIRNCRGVIREEDESGSDLPQNPEHSRDFIPVPLPMPNIEGQGNDNDVNYNDVNEEEEEEVLIPVPTETVTETDTEMMTETSTETITATTTTTVTETITETIQPTSPDESGDEDEEAELTTREVAYRT